MQALYDKVALDISKLTTKSYSTSFSLGISLLDRNLHDAIYSIYGFVRFADEIVDSLLEHDRAILLDEFRADTWKAIDRRVSYHPVLQSFQKTVHQFGIDRELIKSFFHSMEMDLHKSEHDRSSYNTYIYGSAEVVGLMCLCVFVYGDMEMYRRLEAPARALGSAFQKVNFLRDIREDSETLGRIYFPGWNADEESKTAFEAEIDREFAFALHGIRQLPRSSRLGVYTAYVYYKRLFEKIKMRHARDILQQRIRIPNGKKLLLALQCWVRVGMQKI